VSSIEVSDWDVRPAVLLSPARAVAILEPGGTWVEVDGLDVAHTGRPVASAEALERLFASTFGAFDLPPEVTGEAPSAAKAPANGPGEAQR
jgi:hypothetical protein